NVSFEDSVLLADFELQNGFAVGGSASAGFDLFGNSGLSADNFELVAVPEPSSAAAVAALGLLGLRRRKK
ncbi:MAG: PEP-CTERM sorting domain-containing protein, partial [Planctomycetota bacterium]